MPKVNVDRKPSFLCFHGCVCLFKLLLLQCVTFWYLGYILVSWLHSFRLCEIMNYLLWVTCLSTFVQYCYCCLLTKLILFLLSLYWQMNLDTCSWIITIQQTVCNNVKDIFPIFPGLKPQKYVPHILERLSGLDRCLMSCLFATFRSNQDTSILSREESLATQEIPSSPVMDKHGWKLNKECHCCNWDRIALLFDRLVEWVNSDSALEHAATEASASTK